MKPRALKHLDKRLAGAAGLAALGALTLWWLMGHSADAPGKAGTASNTDIAQVARTNADAVLASQSNAGPSSSAGLEPAGVGQIKDSFLTPELRQTFETMLLEATIGRDIQDPAALKKRLAALVPQHFSKALAARAAELLDRYIDYRVALGELKAPADPSDPRALRAALGARQSARQRYFTSDEYDALFAEEARLDRYTLAHIEIDRHTTLTAAQKQAALKDAERELSDAQRAQRSAATAHMTVAAQTTELNAGDASDVERFNQRRAQYGDTTATQLAQLDREDRAWQARLDQYATAQAKNASPEQLQQLSQQLFSAPEQLRIGAALAMRQQALPTAAAQR